MDKPTQPRLSARIVTEPLDLAQILSRILDTAGVLTASEAGAVLLHDPARKTLFFAGAVGSNAEFLLDRWGEDAVDQVPIANSTAGRVFDSGEPLMENIISTDTEHYKGVDGQTEGQTRSLLCVPLNVAGERIGVIQVLNKRDGAYIQRDQVVLEHIADLAAIAVRNSRL
ncbi:GAF domain-containing protein, partial [Roseibium sp.]|uniref:GAF domain-containing protein n=1 Tax=Roseibium sp. TaxID=1936156 RepID=UPI003D0F541B